MITNISTPTARNRLAILSLIFGFLSLFSSCERLMEIGYLLDNGSELGNGRLWEQIPQVHLSVIVGGFIIGIVAIMIGIISYKQIIKGSLLGKRSAIAGIILGTLGIISIPILFVFSFMLMMVITG